MSLRDEGGDGALPATPTWVPTAETFARSRLAELERRLGVAGFEDLRRVSLETPEAYWKLVCELSGIRWTTPYREYVDLSAGPAFPRWFVGGRLNWAASVLDRAAQPRLRNQPAVVAEHEGGGVEHCSYEALARKVEAFARGLRTRGFGPGDRIGLMMPMGVEAVITLLGVAHIGAIAIPLFTGFGVDAIRARLEPAGATGLVIGDGMLRRGRRVDLGSVAAAAARELPDLRLIMVKRYDERPLGQSRVPAIEWDTLITEGAPQEPQSVDANHPCMILYTSGTTGAPKGTVHIHGGFPLKVAHDALVHFDLRATDVWFWPADMGWVVGPIVTIAGLLHGATIVCYDGAPDMPSWSRMSEIISRHGVTHFGCSPTLVRALAAHGAGMPADMTSQLRVLITAGEVIDPEHFVWYQQAFGGCPIINYSGGTEASGGLLGNILERPITPSSFNAVSPGVDVDVVDERGEPLLGAVGELAVRAPFVGMTASFWNDRERYLETYWQTHPGLWIHGDLALRTAAGTYFLLGRSDDSLKLAGKRVGPAEVEVAALQHPDVAEAAAVGVPDPMKGERVVLFIVLRQDREERGAMDREVADAIERSLGRPFRPARVHAVRQLPKTRNGKVMRRVIRRVYVGLPPGDLSSLEDPTALELIVAARASVTS